MIFVVIVLTTVVAVVVVCRCTTVCVILIVLLGSQLVKLSSRAVAVPEKHVAAWQKRASKF